jgi:benzoyl-CoA reductase/2-hydroxyglutaryl-CoA dehydratase subunit BcrC/BadD/HgdB
MQKLAYFDSAHDTPEEIITAAGLLPYKIVGDVHISNEPADQYLANFFCPQARSFLTEALGHSKEWAGIVVAHGCDATNRHFDIWKIHVETPFLHWINTPMKTDQNAAKFYKVELERFRRELEAKFKTQITPDKIKAAIKESNAIKSKLRELAALRTTKDIPNKEYFEMVKTIFTVPRSEALPMLEQKLKEWIAKPAFPANKKKILLTGSDITYSEWWQMLDEAGLRVVRDDLSIGERYFAHDIPTKDDPLDALIDYNFNVPRPSTRHPPDSRLDFLLQQLQETKVDAVVSQNVKFCEVYAFDSVFINNAIKAKGTPVMHLEREFTPIIDQQLVNRLEAFRETLGGS